MNRLAHWWKKIRRGPIVSQIETETGDTLREYRSGYIEHIATTDGKRTDVLWDLHRRKHRPRTWRCARVNGGGSVIYENMTEVAAVKRCSAELGSIVYVDDIHGFIFYRDASPASGPMINAPTPRF